VRSSTTILVETPLLVAKNRKQDARATSDVRAATPPGIAYLSSFFATDEYLAPDFAERKARLCTDLGATEVFFFLHARGYAPYPSRYMPSFPHLREDLLQKLIEAHHRAGVRFFACWCAVNDFAEAWINRHPDWVQVNPDGSKGICLCYHGPARAAILGQVREVLARYAVDAIYLDQLPVACFCEACRADYKARRGQPMPKVASAPWLGHGAPVRIESGERIQDDAAMVRELESFSEENLVAFLRDVRALINELRPGTLLLVNKVWGHRCATVRTYVDGYLPEVLW